MKKNKNLIILLLIAVIGIVGVTIAYFSSTTTFENEFQTSEYGTTYIEKFVSPDNWLPGDVTGKTLEVRNSGTVDEAVRVKVEESWISQNGTTLPLKQGDNVAADIHLINGDDWTKVTVDGEDYYYYYYNYKLVPEETTSKLLDKVTFNPLINATTSCSDAVENGVTTRTCNSSGAGYDGATYTLKFTIETVQYNKYSEAWGTGNTIILLDEKPNPLTVQDMILQKTNPVTITNYTDGNIHEMYTFEHEATEQTSALTDYRYIGDDPYNYVYFNCDSLDNQNDETCEVWRIIGIFDVEREVDDEENPGEKKTITETRMKLIRGSALAETMAWDSNNINDWVTATLNTFLNENYLNREGNAVSNGLKSSASNLIDDTKFYLGYMQRGLLENIYITERSKTVFGDNSVNWIGKVALIYPSDAIFTYSKGVNSNCSYSSNYCYLTTQGWIYNTNIVDGQSTPSTIWFLSPTTVNSSNCYQWTKGGEIYNMMGLSNGQKYYSDVNGASGIRPVLYLSSNVKITEGTGEQNNPYKLGL